MEELWGKIVERRGSITLEQMPDSHRTTVQKLSTEHVLELIRSEGNRSVRGLLASMEMRRRENWTSRAALVLSLLALAISATVALTRSGA